MTRLLVLALLASTSPALAQYPTAAGLKALCDSTDGTKQTVCSSYISGVIDTLVITTVMQCEPNDYDPATMREAALARMGQPDQADRIAVAVIYEAVQPVFPCEALPPQ